MVEGFEVGGVPFNPDGWGPPDSATTPTTTSNLPLNVPFAPFSRAEKLGRIADWTRTFNNPARSKNPSDSVFDFSNDESFPASADDDASFRLVDGKPPPRPRFGPKWRFQQQRQLPHRRDEEVEAKKREAEKERARRDRQYNMNRSNVNVPRREAAVFKSSVDIQPEWNMLDQIPFSTFSKLSFSVPEPEDLLLCGGLEFYDRSCDRITPKNERRLERFKNRNFFKVTTTDDPVIRRLANEDKATVFATDTILSTLMCAPRSIYSWDIVVQRVGNKLFFDKRDGSQLDLLSVHETSQEPLPEAKDDINSAYSLSVEAAYINQNFSQQVLIRDGNKVTFDEPNPFANEGEEVASVAYRYRRWKLEEGMYLVARCEVQSVMEVNNQRSFLTLNALNEFDPKYSGVDWRQKLETQRGAVLATELKNNANKLAKWTAQKPASGSSHFSLSLSLSFSGHTKTSDLKPLNEGGILKMMRKKIKIKKIDCLPARQVTFSKRRRGIFKKAAELSVLCESKVAVVIFSATGKLFDYSSSSIKDVIESYKAHKNGVKKSDEPSVELQLENENHIGLSKELEEKSHQLRQMKAEDLEELNFDELQKLEQLVDTSLSRVIETKEELRMSEIMALERKGAELVEANNQLKQTMVMLSGGNTGPTLMDPERLNDNVGGGGEEEGMSSESAISTTCNSALSLSLGDDSDDVTLSLELGLP